MPKNTFAGDRRLAVEAAVNRDQRPEKIIGYLNLEPGCFNKDSVITTNLNQVRVLFAGALKELDLTKKSEPAKGTDPNKPQDEKQTAQTPTIQRTPLIMTTAMGNAWTIANAYELMFPDPAKLMGRFIDGTEPVKMGYLVTGRFKSSFPQGIEIEVEAKDADADKKDKDADPNKPKMVKKHVTGLTEATADCAVIVFSDVDFLTDQMAYANSFFGKMTVGDNAALLVNAVEELGGSGDLISIRSRGNYKRPFTVVDKVEQEAERETADEVSLINLQIEGFNQKLQELVSSAKGEDKEAVVGDAIVQQKRDLELKIHTAQRQLRAVQAKRRERIEQLGSNLKMLDVVSIPAVVMVIALVLGTWRGVRRRHYISHASDA
jgi:ABC-2 type transport system permease protein